MKALASATTDYYCKSNNLPVCCGRTYREMTRPWLSFVSDPGRPTLLPRHNSRRL